jgi:Ca2+-binding RTX toxin-like protein
MPTLTANDARVDIGPWSIINNVWGRRDLVNGVDFTQSVTYDPGTVPDGVTVEFDWPSGTDRRVYSYPELSTGWNPWAERGGDRLVGRIDEIRDYDLRFDYTATGLVNSYNVALDIWLTDSAGGDRYAITGEVFIGLSEPAGNLPPDGPLYTDPSGFQARLEIYEDISNGETTWDLIGLVPVNNVQAGSLDLEALFDWLVLQGAVSATDYVGGLEFGVEALSIPGGSRGTVTINDLDLTFVADRRITGTEAADSHSTADGDDRIDGRGGDDRLNGGAGRDTLSGDAGADRVNGQGGDDSLAGGSGNDTIYGGNGADRLSGGQGNDLLRGGGGADRLHGGSGADTLYGGSGADVFVFGRGAGDTIADFDALDRIDLSVFGLSFGTGPSVGQAKVWVETAGQGWRVKADTDGDGNADISVLVSGEAPQAADLIL